MVRYALRRWPAAAALTVAGLALVLSGSPPSAASPATTPSPDAEISRPWALLEQSLVTLRPQVPSAAWIERASPRPLSQAAVAVVAGLAAGVALAWLPFSGALPGRPPLRRRRYSVARRAPPLLRLAERP